LEVVTTDPQPGVAHPQRASPVAPLPVTRPPSERQQCQQRQLPDVRSAQCPKNIMGGPVFFSKVGLFTGLV